MYLYLDERNYGTHVTGLLKQIEWRVGTLDIVARRANLRLDIWQLEEVDVELRREECG